MNKAIIITAAALLVASPALAAGHVHGAMKYAPGHQKSTSAGHGQSAKSGSMTTTGANTKSKSGSMTTTGANTKSKSGSTSTSGQKY